jgi:FkbM family methyltransferase
MKVLCSPGDLPAGQPYKIFGRGPRSRHLGRLLEVLRPDVPCLGFEDEPSGFGAHAIVLVDADWAKVEARLLAEGCHPDRILLFPVPEKEFWAFWDFSVEYIDSIVRRDGAVAFSAEDFVKYVMKLGRISVRDGEVQVPTWAYAAFMKDAIQANREKIDLVRDHLSDRASRDVLDRIFGEGPRGQWHYYWQHCFEHVQYFDYVTVRPGDVIINGGVLSGCEIPLFLAHLQGDGQVHNVDPLGFDYLSDYAKASIDTFSANVFEHRLAFSDRRGTLSLPVSSDAHGAQAIGKYRDQTIEGHAMQDFPCLTVDQFVADQQLKRVDLVKFDLEGAEEYVLPGMMETINRFRPQLAVSIYHKIEHIWDLPIYLMERLPEYHFFLDIYSFERFEIILYCVPFERPVRRLGAVEVAPPAVAQGRQGRAASHR